MQDEERITKLTIHWPGRAAESWTDLESDRIVEIQEGRPEVIRLSP